MNFVRHAPSVTTTLRQPLCFVRWIARPMPCTATRRIGCSIALSTDAFWSNRTTCESVDRLTFAFARNSLFRGGPIPRRSNRLNADFVQQNRHYAESGAHLNGRRLRSVNSFCRRLTAAIFTSTAIDLRRRLLTVPTKLKPIMGCPNLVSIVEGFSMVDRFRRESVAQHGFYARPSAHLGSFGNGLPLPWYNFRSSGIVRFVQGGVVKTFRCRRPSVVECTRTTSRL